MDKDKDKKVNISSYVSELIEQYRELLERLANEDDPRNKEATDKEEADDE